MYGCMSTVYNSLYSSYVRLPGSVCLAVGMRHVMSENYAFSADITFSHLYRPPFYGYITFKISKKYSTIYFG